MTEDLERAGGSSPRAPAELRTERLLLRPWRPADAAELHPILVENYERLSPWIPARVADPGNVASLEQRLAGFAAAFEDDREWRYSVRSLADASLLGEIALFPRSAAGRTNAVRADRAEVGYWLRADATGKGLATEAACAMLDLATHIPEFLQVEIRCDSRNAPSGAVPRRLGFVLAGTNDDAAAQSRGPDSSMQVWTLPRSAAGGWIHRNLQR